MGEQATLDALKTQRARRPELATTLDLYIAILEARAGVEIGDWRLAIDEADARSRLERGEPIVRANDLALDWNRVAQLARAICAVAARHRPDAADAFVEIAREFESSARAQELAREYLSRITDHASLDTFVLNHALHPYLAAAARQLQTRVRDDAWQRGACPICGGAPDFAALAQEGGAWRLLCSRCDAEWTCPRAHCPFCGAEQIAYFPSQDGAYRLYGCDHCKRYLKTIDLRELARDAHLPAERVLTIGMDVAARAAGYCSGQVV